MPPTPFLGRLLINPLQMWTISNLKSLSVRGETWTKPTNAPYVSSMLKLSPALQVCALRR